MALLLNRAKVVTATTGTGTVTLGAAVIPMEGSQFSTWADAGAVDGKTYAYLIEDGSDWELGQGVYTASGTTLSRATVTRSQIGGTSGTTKITLSGFATVACVCRVDDQYIPPLLILQRTTNQSINNTTDTAVSWDNPAIQDDLGAWSSGTPTIWTVPTGYTKMRVTAYTDFAANSTGQRNVTLQTGTTIIEGQSVKANNESAMHFTTRWLTVSGGQTYNLKVYQDSGGSLNFFVTLFAAPYVQVEWAL